MYIIIIMAVTFGIMFGLDKLFTAIFRKQKQHQSGLSVKLPHRYPIAGLLLGLLGILMLFQLAKSFEALTLVLSIGLILMSAGLLAYYLGFGIFYDDETFLYASLGKKSRVYRYADIESQQLFTVTGGNTVIDLFLSDGTSISLQSPMLGFYPFLDKACHARFRQLGTDSSQCDWFDESKSCWFPPKEES